MNSLSIGISHSEDFIHTEYSCSMHSISLELIQHRNSLHTRSNISTATMKGEKKVHCSHWVSRELYFVLYSLYDYIV